MLEPLTKATIASIDIDAQCCFSPLCPDELPVPGGLDIVSELNMQAKLASVRIGSKDAHPPEAIWVATASQPMLTPIKGDNVDVRWVRHAVPGTRGFESLPGLPKVTDYDFFVWKGIEPDLHPYGICYHDFAEHVTTGLIEFLHTRHIRTLIVGGLATDYCVKVSVLQLCHAGFHVWVNLAACRGLDENTSAIACERMQAAGARLFSSTAKIIAEYPQLKPK